MSDYLRRLQEAHKERVARLQEAQKKQVLKVEPLPPHLEKCLALVGRTYRKRVNRRKKIIPITSVDLLGPSRTLEIARAREIAIYLTRKTSTLSLQAIGKGFGNRHHTTVLHAIRRIEAMRAKSPRLNREIALLLERVQV